MWIGYSGEEVTDGGCTGDALLRAFSESAAAVCLCDAADVIRYANATFRAAFFPAYDGGPADFMETIVRAMKAGTGIKLVSADPDDFAPAIRARRLAMVGSRSFATDMVDGTWWSVTDTKLSNGWLLAVAQDISSLKHEEAKLRDAHESALTESQTDYLTGAPNRRHGLRRAETLWKAARADGTALSLALLDVDHFKSINDVYGHEAGDRALLHFTRFMMANLGPEDQFSRLGGDEFLVVRTEVGPAPLAADLGEILSAMPPVDLDGAGESLKLSISVGVAVARHDDSWPGLMHRADMALYDAKAGGRNRIALAG